MTGGYRVAQSHLRREVGGKCSAETGCASGPFTGTGQSLLIVFIPFEFLIAQYLWSDSQNSWLGDDLTWHAIFDFGRGFYGKSYTSVLSAPLYK